MVLSQPENQHVMKAFDLTGKVAAITGKPTVFPTNTHVNSSRRRPRYRP